MENGELIGDSAEEEGLDFTFTHNHIISLHFSLLLLFSLCFFFFFFFNPKETLTFTLNNLFPRFIRAFFL